MGVGAVNNETMALKLLSMEKEIAGLKQAKRAGLLMRSYQWTGSSLTPGRYRITFTGAPKVFPALVIFHANAVVSPFLPETIEQGGQNVYICVFDVASQSPFNIAITSTSAIASVTRIGNIT